MLRVARSVSLANRFGWPPAFDMLRPEEGGTTLLELWTILSPAVVQGSHIGPSALSSLRFASVHRLPSTLLRPEEGGTTGPG